MHKSAPLCLLISGLTLTACNNGGTPTPPLKTDFVQPTAIEGTVQLITASNTATVHLRTKDGLTTVSSAPIKAVNSQYTFSLPLPSAALTSKLESISVTSLYQQIISGGDCTGTIQVDDLVAKIYVLSGLELVDGTTVTNLLSITVSSLGESSERSLNSWVYSLSNVTMTGTQSCPDGKNNIANIHFKPGWNAFQFSSGKNGGIYQSVDPTKTVWRQF